MKANYAKMTVVGLLLVLSLAFTTSCGKDKAGMIKTVNVEEERVEEASEDVSEELNEIKDTVVVSFESEDTEEEEPEEETPEEDEEDEEPVAEQEEEPVEEPVEESAPKTGGHIVCIDPGHQGKGMSEHEPIGPGASETKPKVSSGTTGVATGKAEYVMTLEVGLKLRDELRARGYTVVMTRESHDVSLSNADRAAIATNAGAEVFIRLHGNGVDNHDTSGALTMCMTSGNPYNAYLHDSSRRLSDLVLSGLCNATGAGNKGVTETDSMSGINWATMPVTIVEMGFMSNPTEDSNLSNADYQYKLAAGMANGIDAYFNN